jgi:uncharacterized membrane protein YdbT with pleckstrin-like domain
VPDLIIQPTKKWIRLQYWTVFVVLCICIGVYVNKYEAYPRAGYFLILPALLFLFPVRSHVRQHFTKVTLSGDKLRYELGVVSKATRTIQLSKIQDVTVNQSLAQRLAGTGNLSIETAGEASRLTVVNIDDAQAVADAITDAAHDLGAKQKGAPF